MPFTKEQLEEFKIRNDEEAEAAIEAIRKAQKQLRSMCKKDDCTNPRRNGSAYCTKCSADYHRNASKE